MLAQQGMVVFGIFPLLFIFLPSGVRASWSSWLKKKTDIDHQYRHKLTLMDVKIDLRPTGACSHVPDEDCHVRIEADVTGQVGFRLKYDLDQCLFEFKAYTPAIELHAEIDWHKPADYWDQSSFDGLPWHYDYEFGSAFEIKFHSSDYKTVEIPFCQSGTSYSVTAEACAKLSMTVMKECDFSKWTVEGQGTLGVEGWEYVKKYAEDHFGSSELAYPRDKLNLGEYDLYRRLRSQSSSENLTSLHARAPKNISAMGERQFISLVDLGKPAQSRGEAVFAIDFSRKTVQAHYASQFPVYTVGALASIGLVSFAVLAVWLRRRHSYERVEAPSLAWSAEMPANELEKAIM